MWTELTECQNVSELYDLFMASSRKPSLEAYVLIKQAALIFTVVFVNEHGMQTLKSHILMKHSKIGQ